MTIQPRYDSPSQWTRPIVGESPEAYAGRLIYVGESLNLSSICSVGMHSRCADRDTGPRATCACSCHGEWRAETVTFSHHAHPPTPVPHDVQNMEQDEWVESPQVEPTVWTKAGKHYALDRMTENAVRDLVYTARVAPEGGRNQQWVTLHGHHPRLFTLAVDLKEIEAVTWHPVHRQPNINQ